MNLLPHKPVDRLNNIIGRIHESRKDRYLSMFKKLEKLGIPAWDFGASFDELVDKVVKVLKRDDRIIWFLRYYRIFCLIVELVEMEPDQMPVLALPGDREAVEELRQFFIDEYNARRKREGLPEVTDRDFYGGIPSASYTLRELKHLFSLGIYEIDNYVFSAHQTPAEGIASLIEMERLWAKRSNRQLDISLDYKEGAVDIIEFDSGWKWINLNRPSCRREAQAMGHCGNQQVDDEDDDEGEYGHNSTDTILSLREPLKKTIWRPHATFILDKDGNLGEMKGYANSKPDKKYHHYIVELLKLPIIKGILGGGYLYQNNFDLSDLNKNQYNEVIAANPGLRSEEDE
jgi:hypothetical protein